MSERDFNPKSPDAMFALILNRLDNQDSTIEARHAENAYLLGVNTKTLEEILKQTTKTNGRVTKSEEDIRMIKMQRTQTLKCLVAWGSGASFVGGAVWAVVSKFL